MIFMKGLVSGELRSLSVAVSIPNTSFALHDLRDLIILITSDSGTFLMLKAGSIVFVGHTLIRSAEKPCAIAATESTK